MVIFVDTSALIALADKEDEFHEAAKQQWRDMLERGETLVSNNYVVLETISLIQRRFGMAHIHSLHANLLNLLNIHWIDEDEHNQIINVFLKFNRRNLSLVDCSSFDTMRRLEIETAFTFDPHFREQGFSVIP
jgi:predicted nucleic acid-binding protein